MPPNVSFGSQSFNPFSVKKDLKDNDQYPDVNFCQTRLSSRDTNYYIPNENLENFQQKSFSVLHLNIRSMSKNFESFEEFLDSLCFTFSTIYLSETRCQPHETSNSNLQIPGNVSLHQTRKNCRGGALCIFLLESFSYKFRDEYIS